MHPNTTARQLMLAGQPYHADDAELSALRQRARGLLARFNHTGPEAFDERRALLQQLFAAFGEGSVVTPTFQCDYGFNISVGRNAFFNFDCVLLDCNRIDIGDDVLFGPGVHVYTATHPLEAQARRAGVELARPVSIGAGVWLGGRTVVCPGVSIGENTVVGAGSVVVHSLPAGVLAVGNPCRVVRTLES
jgi:maltose O-acetyltransferase